MIPGDALLSAFINANILIILAYFLWLAIRFLLVQAGLKHSHLMQLRLLNTVFVVIMLSPFLVVAFSSLQNAGHASAVNINLSDMVVAYYLNGGFQMQATEFERLVNLRDISYKPIYMLIYPFWVLFTHTLHGA